MKELKREMNISIAFRVEEVWIIRVDYDEVKTGWFKTDWIGVLWDVICGSCADW